MTDTGKEEKKKQPSRDESKPPPSNKNETVRPAGPNGAGINPEEWDKVDEEVDESFPASDAPSNY